MWTLIQVQALEVEMRGEGVRGAEHKARPRVRPGLGPAPSDPAMSIPRAG